MEYCPPYNYEVEKAKRILEHRRENPNLKNDNDSIFDEVTAESAPELIIKLYELRCWRERSRGSNFTFQ